jgi:hypothetical protein
MYKLYLLLFIIIVFIIFFVIFNFTKEPFKNKNKNENENKLNYLSINTLIDITEKLNMVKNVLNDTEVKLNYNISILNETKTTGTPEYMNNIDTINGKFVRLEMFKTDIAEKTNQIDKLKDNIYNKLSKELIQNIEELAEVNIKYKNIYRKILELTTTTDFKNTNKLIKNDLSTLDNHLIELKDILVDIITRFF